MRRRRTLGVVSAAVSMLLVVGAGAGCGDDRRADGEFLRSAAAICDESAEQIEVASAQLTAQSTPEQYAAFFVDFFLPAYRERLARLRELEAPGDERLYGALIDDTAAVLDTIEADPQSFAVAVNPFADVDQRWDAAGLVACGSRRADPGSTLSP